MGLLLHTYSLIAAMNSHVEYSRGVGQGRRNECRRMPLEGGGQAGRGRGRVPALLPPGWAWAKVKMVASRLHRKCILIVKICTDISSKIVACPMAQHVPSPCPLLSHCCGYPYGASSQKLVKNATGLLHSNPFFPFLIHPYKQAQACVSLFFNSGPRCCKFAAIQARSY